MFQFYLLSILFNSLAGLILISIGKGSNVELSKNSESADWLDEQTVKTKKTSRKESLKKVENKISSSEIFSNQTFRLVVGILALLTGIIKFFVVVKSGLLFFADFFPAVAGIIGGFGLLFNFYVNKTSMYPIPEVLNVFFIKNTTILGFICICIALLHFIFPTTLFL